MRRYVSLLGIATLCACSGGARAGRAAAPSTEPATPTVAGPTVVAGATPGTPRADVTSGADVAPRAGAAPGAEAGPRVPPAPLPELAPSVVPRLPSEPPVVATAPGEPVPVPSVLDRTESVARRILTDAGFRVRVEDTARGVKGRVMDQLPSPGDRVPRGAEILLKVPGYVPTPESVFGSPDAAPQGVVPSAPPIAAAPATPPATPTAPPAPPPAPPSSSAEVAGVPAAPSLPGLEVPKPKSPPSESRIPIAASVTVDLTWEAVVGASGYLIEVEELADDTWVPLQRRIVKTTTAVTHVEPGNPTAADFRWRVRSVVGRRGGRPSPWIVFHLR